MSSPVSSSDQLRTPRQKGAKLLYSAEIAAVAVAAGVGEQV
jgi:hypothetical protein